MKISQMVQKKKKQNKYLAAISEEIKKLILIYDVENTIFDF